MARTVKSRWHRCQVQPSNHTLIWGHTDANRVVSSCQSAVAEAVEAFGRIDVLLCAAGESMALPFLLHCGKYVDGFLVALIGSVEELAQNKQTISLVDETFELNFFANVNIIKTVLPVMRERNNGHIIVITGTSKPLRLHETSSH